MQFQKWSTFHEEMIGKRVNCLWQGDCGTVISRRTMADGSTLPSNRVYVLWDSGAEMHSLLHDVEFTGNEVCTTVSEEITINGKRYKLVPIEEE